MKGCARQKRLLFAVKPADRQIRKRKVHETYKYNLICIFQSHGYKLMSQDSREKFGVKSQMRGGEAAGKERKERKDMLKAGQSRGSIVCVNGVIIKQCGS